MRYEINNLDSKLNYGNTSFCSPFDSSTTSASNSIGSSALYFYEPGSLVINRVVPVKIISKTVPKEKDN